MSIDIFTKIKEVFTMSKENNRSKQSTRRSLAVGLTGLFYFGSRLYLLYRLAKQEILKSEKTKHKKNPS